MKKHDIFAFWSKKNAKEKAQAVMKTILWIGAFVLLLFSIFGAELFGEGSAFATVFHGDDSGFDLLGQWIDQQIPIILRSIIYIIMAIVVSQIVSFILTRLLLVSKRGMTAVKLLQSFIKYLTAVIIIIMVLLVFGVDPTALFASVGILGLVIGLSAQSLISDIINGLFIVFENEFQVNDYIIIDGFRGQVASIGIRTTQLIDAGGNLKVVNNSEIKTIVNLSASPSTAVVDISVHYADFAKADNIFKEHIHEIQEHLPKFLEAPQYVGPVELADSGINVRFVGKVDESYRFQAERDLRTELVSFMEKYKLEIPYPRLVIVNLPETNR